MKNRPQGACERQFRAAHGARFEYPSGLGRWIDPVEVRCRIHGTFRILPRKHVARHGGCGGCLRLEQEIAAAVNAARRAAPPIALQERIGIREMILEAELSGTSGLSVYWMRAETPAGLSFWKVGHSTCSAARANQVAAATGARVSLLWDFDVGFPFAVGIENRILTLRADTPPAGVPRFDGHGECFAEDVLDVESWPVWTRVRVLRDLLASGTDANPMPNAENGPRK